MGIPSINKTKVFLMMLADFAIITAMGLITRYLVIGDLKNIRLVYIILIALLQVCVFLFSKFYRIRIQDSSLELVLRALYASLPIAATFCLSIVYNNSFDSPTFRWSIIFYVFSFLGITGVRVLYRILKTKRIGLDNLNKKRALIYGAGTIGVSMASLNKMGKFDYNIIGFIDDDAEKAQEIIKDHPVLGDLEDLNDVLQERRVDCLIIAITNIAREKMQKALEIAKNNNIEVKVVPSLFELQRGKKELDLRSVNYEDLLGRSLRVIEREPVAALVSGKTVMVTGAGGSIGSEISRQLTTYPINRIILLDIDETELHDLSLRLLNYTAEWSDTVIPVVCDIRNSEKVHRIFETYKPDIVFHAAAYKHVPLMEKFPEEAIITNIQGSYNVLSAAAASRASKVVVISTDKAVNPTNVMGATKRVVEMIASSLSTKSTPICCVRFGNVIGSRGSMLPLFVEEIKAGVPITVTDKRIVRYFMAIPEAVSLVFRAATLAQGSEVMVLDMGEAVNIYEFAQKLINLYGTKENTIKITGLRPGEKLYEEVLASDDTTVKTVNDQIRKAVITDTMTPEQVHNLLSSLNNKTPKELVDIIKATVPEFSHDKLYC